MDVIPAIDLLEGRCVRLYQGDYEKSQIFNENPADVAKQWADEGATKLHVVDLDGAKAGHIVNFKVLERLASKTSLHIDFGGGLKSDGSSSKGFFLPNASGIHATAGVSIKELVDINYTFKTIHLLFVC